MPSRPHETALLGVRVADLFCLDGVWHALLWFEGQTFRVDRSIGSWRITPSEDEDSFQHVTPSLAAELQRRVRSSERAARRAN